MIGKFKQELAGRTTFGRRNSSRQSFKSKEQQNADQIRKTKTSAKMAQRAQRDE